MSSPINKPPPNNASTEKSVEPRLTAPMAVALFGKWPTMTVSTMAMLIQPSSASTSGSARRNVGRSSLRSVEIVIMTGRFRKCMRSGTKSQLNPLFTGGVKSGGSSIDLRGCEIYARNAPKTLHDCDGNNCGLRRVCRRL